MNTLEAMTVFAAVCDARGFASAARRLGMAPSVVTRQVGALEEALGVRLLQRTTRSLRLTDAGERYLARVRVVLAEVEEANEAARGDPTSPRGCLVVTAPLIFGRLHVVPLLRRYMHLYPDVTVELQLDDRNLSMVEEGIDVAIRIGALADSGLVTRRIGETKRVTVASPAYLNRRGRPHHPSDLKQHETVVFQPFHAKPEWTFVDRSGDTESDLVVAIAPRFGTNSGDAALEIVLEGGGLTRAMLYQALPLIRSGQLVTVLDDFAPAPSPIQAVVASRRLLSTRIRAFINLTLAEAAWEFSLIS